MTHEQNFASNFLWKNPQQNGLQLIAGAGSGKTKTLIATVVRYTAYGGNTQDICLITFTKKAAQEMNDRLNKQNIHVGFIGTMHSLAYQLITKSVTSKLKIITDTTAIYRALIKEKYQKLLYIPVEFLISNQGNQHPETINLVQDYTNYKQQNNLYDFEDLITKSTELLNNNIIKSHYPIVLVDEFQDTSPSQFNLIQAMRPKKLFVVGDDWQSIYRFRGADLSIMSDFTINIQDTTRLFLTKNFRSQKRIVKLGNQLIRLSKNYISKKLTAYHNSTHKPVCLIFQKDKYSQNNLKDNWAKIVRWNQKNKFCINPTILVRTNAEQAQLRKIIPKETIITTLHSAKGLEFESVIIWGIQNAVIPHQWGDLDEEIRLLYVGITRAKSQLQFIVIEGESKNSFFFEFLFSKCKVVYI